MISRSDIQNASRDRQPRAAGPLDSVLEGLSGLNETAPTNPGVVGSVGDWLDRAERRPEWFLWGKAQPLGACPAHPLLCHMVDVAAVAGRLLTRALPRSLRTRRLTLRGLSEAVPCNETLSSLI